jgi:Ca2+-binding RTX toxin-like protein
MSWLTRFLTAHRDPAHPARLAVEELAPRDVPAVAWAVEGDVLHFIGTDGDDYVRVVKLAGGGLGMYAATDATSPVPLSGTAAVASIRFDGLAGNDTFVNGTALPSLAYGGDGRDHLVGGAGRDVFWGGSGNDTLEGKGGGDELRGEGGDDLIRGGAGGDQLYGEDGNDKIYGGDGDDYIDGGAGTDTIDPGAGRDAVVSDPLNPDQQIGGKG